MPLSLVTLTALGLQSWCTGIHLWLVFPCHAHVFAASNAVYREVDNLMRHLELKRVLLCIQVLTFIKKTFLGGTSLK